MTNDHSIPQCIDIQCMFHDEEYQLHRFLSILGLKPQNTTRREEHVYNTLLLKHHTCRVFTYLPRKPPSHLQRNARLFSKILTESPCSYTIRLIKADSRKYQSVHEIVENKRYNQNHVLKNKLPDKYICSRGGALFQIVIQGSQTRSLCHTRDLFNGTYRISCYIHENGMAMEVKLMSSNFKAYSNGKMENKVLFKIPMPNLISPTHNLRGETFGNRCVSKKGNRVKMLPYWTHDIDVLWQTTFNNVSRMVIKNIHWNLFRREQPQKVVSLIKCLKNYNEVLIMGDSNMRYIFYHLLQKVGKLNKHLPQILRRQFTQEKFSYFWAPYAKQIAKALHNISKIPTTFKKSKLILINCGVWHWGDMLRYVTEMEDVFKEVEALQRKDNTTRIIWVGSTPVPGYPSFATNSWVYDRMRRNEVEIFDLASLIYPFNEQLVCGSHYICIIPRTNKVFGTVGIVAVEELYQHICCS